MDSREHLTRLADRYKQEFGLEMGLRIQRILIEELGGLRLTIPDIRELAKEERNERIRAAFTGANHEELALRFGCSVRHVRRIVF